MVSRKDGSCSFNLFFQRFRSGIKKDFLLKGTDFFPFIGLTCYQNSTGSVPDTAEDLGHEVQRTTSSANRLRAGRESESGSLCRLGHRLSYCKAPPWRNPGGQMFRVQTGTMSHFSYTRNESKGLKITFKRWREVRDRYSLIHLLRTLEDFRNLATFFSHNTWCGSWISVCPVFLLQKQLLFQWKLTEK